MRHPSRIIALVSVIVPALSARAQLQSANVAAVRRVPLRGAPVCDGSAMTSAEHRRMAGNVFLVGAAGVGLWGLLGHESRATTIGTFSVGLGFLATGAVLHWSSHPRDAFWNEIVARAKPGETTSADVRSCLHAPDATSVGSREEEWTYFMRRPWFEAANHTYRSVSFTFRADTLTNVRRMELKARADEMPVPASPVPLLHGTPEPR